MPETILRYKYVPFDESFIEPFDKKGSLSIIKDGTIKFTHAKNFNDPFDCYPEVDIKKLSKAFAGNNGIFKQICDARGLSPEQRIQEKPKLRKKLESKMEPYFSNEGLRDQIGVCCLSKNPLNLLMWAHYATRHTGFVVEFSIPIKSTLSDDLNCLVPFPVEYKKEKPIVGEVKVRDFFLTKGKDWEYEQEERVLDFDRGIDSEKGYKIHPYDRKQILKSVIAGMRMSDNDFVVLKNTVDAVNTELGTNVAVHKAKSLQGKFALFVQDRDDLNVHNSTY